MMENENLEGVMEESADFKETTDFPTIAPRVETKTETKAGAKDETPAFVYVGPSFPGAKRFTVYVNGLPEALEDKTESDPVFKGLVLPVAGLAEANAEFAQRGSRLNILYQEAQKKLTGRSE